MARTSTTRWLRQLLLTGMLGGGLATPHRGYCQDATANARYILRAALEAMGGNALVGLRGLRVSGMMVENLDVVGPWGGHPPAMYSEFTELRDLQHLRIRRDSRFVLPQRSEPVEASEIIEPNLAALRAGPTWSAGSATSVKNNWPGIAFGPERIALAALAGDPALDSDTIINGSTQHVVTLQDDNIRIFIDADSRLPTAVEVVQSYDGDPGWGVWGDVRTRTYFTAWALAADGIRLPRMFTVYRNGRLWRRIALGNVVTGGDIPADSFAVSDSLRMAFSNAPPRDTFSAEQELSPGVVLLTGPFNVVLVRQSDGVVVVEAPHSAAYSRSVLEEAARRFADLPVKALVTTTQVWPQLAGIREYVARGIPIFAPEGSATVIRAMARAPHSISPDSLSLAPRSPRITEVNVPLTLGAGEDRIVLVPNRGPGAEHWQMMPVLIPDPKIVYGSDLFIPQRFEPNLWRQKWDELVQLARRNDFRPQTAVGVHLAATPWEEVLGVLADTSP